MSPENLYNDEDTLTKVYAGLLAAGLSEQAATDAVNAMQNRGILFRERAADPPADGISASTMHRLVALIPGENGWWHSHGLDRYRAAANDLLTHGYTPAQALAFLEDVYSAAAGEFGS